MTARTGTPEREGGDPRNNADDAYATFMDMDDREFLDATVSSMGGFLFELAEREGYERAVAERRAKGSDHDS